MAQTTFGLGESKAWKKLGYDLWRAPIPGGWLLATFTAGSITSQSFVPDPGHTWDGRSAMGPAEVGRLSMTEP